VTWRGTNDNYSIPRTKDDATGSYIAATGGATVLVGARDAINTATLDFKDAGMPREIDGEILILLKWRSAATNPSPVTNFGPMFAVNGHTIGYQLRIDDSKNQISVIGREKGGGIAIYETASVGLERNQDYWVRYRRINDNFYAKVWKYGVPEPTKWTLQFLGPIHGPAEVPETGIVGFASIGSSSGWVEVELGAFYFFRFTGTGYKGSTIGGFFEDTFQRVLGSSTVNKGWGTSDTRHVWELGLGTDDPANPAIVGISHTILGSGRWVNSALASVYGRAGPNFSGPIELLAKARIQSIDNTATAQMFFYIRAPDGVNQGEGYRIRLRGGQTTIDLQRINSDGTTTTLETGTVPVALTSGITFWIRAQHTVDNTLRARVWQDGSAEPGTWQVSQLNHSVYTSGRTQILLSNTAATASRTWHLNSIKYGPIPTAPYTTVTGIASQATVSSALDLSLGPTADAFVVENVPTENYGTHNELHVRGQSQYRREAYILYDLRNITNTVVKVHHRLWPTNNPDNGWIDMWMYPVDTAFSEGTVKWNNRPAQQPSGLASIRFKPSANAYNSLDISRFYDGPAYYVVKLKDVDTNDDVQVWASRTHPTLAGPSLFLERAPLGTGIRDTAMDLAVTWSGDSDSDNAVSLIRYKRADLDTWTTYGGTVTRGIGKHLFSITGLTSDTEYDVEVTMTDPDGIVGPNPIFGRLKTTAYGPTTTDITVTNLTTTSMTVHANFTGDDDVDSTGQIAYRIYGSGGVFTNATTTADYTNRRHTANISGLTQNTIYEIKATYTDENVYGTNPLLSVVQTAGDVVQLVSMSASELPTSIIITAQYAYDNNNNSSITLQYRSIYEAVWTTVPSHLISVNRTTKQFFVTISPLKPKSTYEFKVVISDPNGVLYGTSNTIQSFFTTTGGPLDQEREAKHYLWKVYDRDGNYITTWNDVSVPEFANHANGGVSDLSVTLPRDVVTLGTSYPDVQFQNRVDVWAIDPSSEGMGPNLIIDEDFEFGAWTLPSGATIDETGGPDGSKSLRISGTVGGERVYSEHIRIVNRDAELSTKVPIVITAMVKARGNKLQVRIQEYDADLNEYGGVSSILSESVGTSWQKLKGEYIPSREAHYIRVIFEVASSVGGNIYVDKVSVRPKEMLIYRGFIEAYTPSISQDGQQIGVQVLGIVAQLSDDFIEFLQFVTVQPQGDIDLGNPNNGPADPSHMLRRVIDMANQQNPRFLLYYTEDSIKDTGTFVEYTFRNQQLRACFDKISALAPPNWHYYIEADGLVVFRGPEHGKLHKLRLGVEIMQFSVDRSIRNLKNFIHVKGRQDEDASEPDGHGSIHYIAQDPASIAKYGKRMMFIRDANLSDPETAIIVGDGRLEEYNREEQRGQAYVPDEKSISYAGGALRGYNIEEFRPGDTIIVYDPISPATATYWDQMVWNEDYWDSSNIFVGTEESVPIVNVQYGGDHVLLELSERQPSAVGDFGRLARWLQLQDNDKGEER
jgi:hypothetical protein